MDSERYSPSEEKDRQEHQLNKKQKDNEPSEDDVLELELDTDNEQRKRVKKKKKNKQSDLWSDDEEYDVVEFDRARKRNKKRRPNGRWQLDEWDD